MGAAGGLFSCLYLVGVAVVKGVVFADDGLGLHGFLQLSNNLAQKNKKIMALLVCYCYYILV